MINKYIDPQVKNILTHRSRSLNVALSLTCQMCISGKLKSGTKKHKGKFEIPNLSEENDPDEIDVSKVQCLIFLDLSCYLRVHLLIQVKKYSHSRFCC